MYDCVSDFFDWSIVYLQCYYFPVYMYDFLRAILGSQQNWKKISCLPLPPTHTQPPPYQLNFFILIFSLHLSLTCFPVASWLCLYSPLIFLLCPLVNVSSVTSFFPLLIFICDFWFFFYVCESASLESISWVHKHHLFCGWETLKL